MTYNFSEMKKNKDLTEDELLILKKEYQKPQMSEKQLEQLQKRIE